ncbi:stage II sporulation protein P [Sporosarcina sp. P37]|uniref:stage II sporulation protein P n=1 Tax=unclassified Sporosarcina TaxID=2647733 RepID=UPI000A17E073|nr:MULTISPECIES: stage II sporulation protein P [unclassified Sporosarcina]ARK24113.1 stage II sporulation protein P [Sporosarcina sp. P37]PID17391.1 stage II sporulation protein P [Sporosarcina sp. P35]
MFPKIKRYSEKKKKSLLAILLYFAIILFLIWLLIVSLLAFNYRNDRNNEKNSVPREESSFSDFGTEMLDSHSGSTNSLTESNASTNSTSDKKVMKSIEQQPGRDEFKPNMKDLLKDRELAFKDLDAIFANMKSPKSFTKDAINSTFGRDVVYIYHTHNRESFLPLLKGANKPEEAYHSKANMILVGQMLGKALERKGVGTKVNPTDIVQELSLRGLDYNSSYELSGDIVRKARNENADLDIFLDLHRDSLRKDSTTVKLNGEDYAQLLFVVGTGHEDFTQNLSFAEGVNNIISTQYPGLSKGILKKDKSQGNGVYNQDLSPNSIIVEIGGVDNTVAELHRSVDALAEGLSEYYWYGK